MLLAAGGSTQKEKVVNKYLKGYDKSLLGKPWRSEVLDIYSSSSQLTSVCKYTFHISKEGWPVRLKGPLH